MQRESFSSNDTVCETDRLLIQKDEEVCVYIHFHFHFHFQFNFRYQFDYETPIEQK